MDKKGNYVAFTASVMTSNGSSVHDTLDHGELS
jgi:gamma-glutamyltranspeptidase